MEAPPPPPPSDIKELLTRLSLMNLYDKFVSEGVTIEVAKELCKTDFLSLLNDIGVAAGPRYRIVAALYPDAPSLLPKAQPTTPHPVVPPKHAPPVAAPPAASSAAPPEGQKISGKGETTVYRGTLHGDPVAIKFLHGVPEEAHEELRIELEALQKLSHPNVLQLLAFTVPPEPCLVTPMMAKGELRGHLNRSGALAPALVRSVTLCVAKGLQYAHGEGFLHRNLKSCNVFLSDSMEALIGDFGLTHARTNCMPNWMAPEMIRKEKCTAAVDVYSLGILIWEMLDGSVPFSHRSFVSEDQFVKAVLRGKRPLKGARHTGVLAELMESCWAGVASKRPTIDHIIRLLEPKVASRQVTTQSHWQMRAPGELSFKRGDKVTVLTEMGDGWCEGETNGKRGRFPSLTISGLDDVRRRAKQNNAAAQHELARRYAEGYGVEKKDLNEAVKWYRKAADQDFAAAQYELGLCYEDGTGVKVDEREALALYRKAAEHRYPIAVYRIAVFYAHGFSVEQDEQLAAKWYRKAAELGDVNGQFYLGVCYEEGKGVAKDAQLAEKWYRKAAEQGDIKGQFRLALCCEKSDQQEAATWYRKAAEQGHAEAQVIIAKCYAMSRGIAKYEQEAVVWYRKAAEQRHTEGLYQLGICYEYGLGIAIDEREAVKWYRQAADLRHVSAQYRLASCYLEGIGLAQDKNEAVKWYTKAAEQGDIDAQNALRELQT